MNEADKEYCRDCEHFEHHIYLSACNYAIHTGKARSLICSAGVGCTEHTKLKGNAEKIKQQLSRTKNPKGRYARGGAN